MNRPHNSIRSRQVNSSKVVYRITVRSWARRYSSTVWKNCLRWWTKVLVMDEGKLIACDTPWKIGNFLAGDTSSQRHPMFYGLPAVMKLYSHCRDCRPADLPAGRQGNRAADNPRRQIVARADFGEPETRAIDKMQNDSAAVRKKRKSGEQTERGAYHYSAGCLVPLQQRIRRCPAGLEL